MICPLAWPVHRILDNHIPQQHMLWIRHEKTKVCPRVMSNQMTQMPENLKSNYSVWWCDNHLETYESQWEILSHILWKIKNVWNHQPVLVNWNYHSQYIKNKNCSKPPTRLYPHLFVQSQWNMSVESDSTFSSSGELHPEMTILHPDRPYHYVYITL